MQLKGFKWKDVARGSYRAICALQLLFCDGTESPIFLAKDTDSNNLQTVNLDLNKTIKSIKSDEDKKAIKQIYFQDKDGNEIAKIFAFKNNEGQTMQLNDGEEIIGIFGNKDSYIDFTNLGFIVWTPVFI